METLPRYVGVIVRCGPRVLLVQVEDYFAPGRFGWTIPSGSVEPDESPEAGAVRELAEESGCRLAPSDLTLGATVTVRHGGRDLSRSWNYLATVADETLAPVDDPDGDVVAAAWFDRAEAVALLGEMGHDPIREPVLRLLAGRRGLAWEFELVEFPPVGRPRFTWREPVGAAGGI